MGNAYRILFGKNGGERSRMEERCIDGSIVVNWIGCENVHWTALLQSKTSTITVSYEDNSEFPNSTVRGGISGPTDEYQSSL